MPESHRNNDVRVCGAKTVVIGQDFVKINGELWAVKDDPNSHGDGQLINSQNYVFINGKLVILKGDHAKPDDLDSIDPVAVGFDATVKVN